MVGTLPSGVDLLMQGSYININKRFAYKAKEYKALCLDVKTKAGDIYITRSYAITFYKFNSLTTPRVAFSINYINVGLDGICKNKVPYAIYEKAYQDLAAPAVPWYRL